MKKPKYKVGDLITLPYAGECEVRKTFVIGGVYNYVMTNRGGMVFSVSEKEIQEMSDEADR